MISPVRSAGVSRYGARLATAVADALTWASFLGSVRMAVSSRPQPLPRWRASSEYLFATAVALLGIGLVFVAQNYLSVANLSLVFLTVVLVVAARTRMTVAVYTALLCFVGYNFFFTQPRYTLAIAHPDDLLAVVLFLLVALVCSRLATRLASQVESLRLAQWHARAMLALGKQLAACASVAAVRVEGVRAMADTLDARVALLTTEPASGLTTLAAHPAPVDLAEPEREAVAWSATHRQPAGRHTARHPRSTWWMVPLDAVAESTEVLALALADEHDAPDEARRELAQAMAADLARALERARLAEALEQARVLGETERLRSALLSSVSHDLRSPLAAMIGAAGTLASYDAQLPADDRRQLMQSILDEGQRLDRYIQNLLDMTRLGHGTLTLHRDWVDAGEIVLAAVARVRKFHPQLRVSTHLPSGTVLLFVHPALIEQALFNILENAAQVSPPEAPVRVELEVSGEQVEIRVIDHGPGIPEDERARIFDTFYSVSRGDRGHKGTGLGLSICRGMVGAHGGSVEAAAGDEGGTILRVRLPLPPTPESAA